LNHNQSNKELRAVINNSDTTGKKIGFPFPFVRTEAYGARLQPATGSILLWEGKRLQRAIDRLQGFEVFPCKEGKDVREKEACRLAKGKLYSETKWKEFDY
jgi:hypothetical protein